MGRDPGRREKLKVTWSDVEAAVPRPCRALRPHPQRQGQEHCDKETKIGDVDAAFANAAKVVEAKYEWPFQSHAAWAPACARGRRARRRRDGVDRHAEAAFLRRRRRQDAGAAGGESAAIWMTGPGSYGRNDAGDAAMDAAVLSKAVGKPVRVQGMRYEGTGWDPKGAGFDPYGARGARRGRQGHCLDFLSQGLLARRREHRRAARLATRLPAS